MPNFPRPKHTPDDGHAHITFGEDPMPNLKKFGYCVVENVFQKTECKTAISGMWDWLESLGTGIDRNNSETWNNINWPPNIHQGMIQHSVGQAEFIWFIREHPNVIELYSQIFKTTDLLVSFDAATIARPIETGFTNSPTNSWLHTDQNIIPCEQADVYTSPFYSVQGIANFKTSGDNDASLLIGKSSHLLHSKLFEHNQKQPRDNWYALTEDDIAFFADNKMEYIKLNAPAGSFILFDSRAIHSGFPHLPNRTKPRFRYVIYVSMSPASRATEEDLQKKKQAVVEGKMTTHWSSCNIRFFPLQPIEPENQRDYFDRPENRPDYENWSELRKRLSGISSY